MGNHPSQILGRRIFTHIIPCTSFANATCMAGPVFHTLLMEWHILIVDNGHIYAAEDNLDVALRFPNSWGCYIFETKERLPDKARWRLMEVLSVIGVREAVFNWEQLSSG